MATKEEVMRFLEESIKTEEVAVPIYTQHIKNALFFSDFSSDLQEKVKKALEHLAEDSSRHDALFKGLLARVKKEARDVY